MLGWPKEKPKEIYQLLEWLEPQFHPMAEEMIRIQVKTVVRAPREEENMMDLS